MLIVRCRPDEQLGIIGRRRLIERRDCGDGIEPLDHCPCGDLTDSRLVTRARGTSAPTSSGGRGSGALYFLGRPHAKYAAHYGVPLRTDRPSHRRSTRARVG